MLQTRSHTIIINHQFYVAYAHQNGGADRPIKVQFLELQKLSELDLDLGSRRSHTGAHIRSRSTHTPN